MSRDVASITIVGRAGSTPQLSGGSTADRVTFRVVSTERRFDKATDTWVDGDEFGVTVVCWRAMAISVITSIRKGDPVVVVGRIVTRRYEKDGVMQYFTEVKADSVALDVARVGSRFTRNQLDPRPAEDGRTDIAEATADHAGADGDATAGAAGDGPAGPTEPDFDDPWGAEAGDQPDRNGALVTVD